MVSAASRPTILVVDDDAAVLQCLTDFLGYIGYEVAGTDTVAGARALLAQEAVVLVLADMRLPDGQGSDLAAQAIALGIPCALMSGDHTDPSGDQPFLAKPFSINQLAAVVEQNIAPAIGHWQ